MKPIDEPNCPYCNRPTSAGGGSTREHVFVKAFGGRATTWACKSCNSTIGHDIEGPLQRPDALFNLGKQTSGKGRPVPGVYGPDDTPVTYNFATGELRTHRPVTEWRDGDVQHFEIRGSPEQVRDVLHKQGRSMEDIERLVAGAQRVEMIEEQVRTTLTYPLGLADRLVAKVALSGGRLALGSDFIGTQLAGTLREVLGVEPTRPRDAPWARW